MYRTVHRLFLSSLRSSTRVNVNIAARSPRTALTRRMMSSESHSAHGSAQSDRPWIIGSALVFGSLFLYLVSPSARKDTHAHTDHAQNSHRGEHADNHEQHVESERKKHVKPIADDEGTEVSGQEVEESMEKAFAADSPKDAKEQEEVVAKAETTTSQDISTTEVLTQGESSTDATLIPEPEMNAAPAVPTGVDDAVKDEKAQSAVSYI
ncbi:hypothetical protein V8E55_006095 [Tylopilus felleus]